MKTEFYKTIIDDQNKQRNSEESPSEYDDIKIINLEAKRQINLAEMVLNENENLDGSIRSLIPLLQLVKEFARYKMISDRSLSESETDYNDFWSKFLFILSGFCFIFLFELVFQNQT